MKTIPITILLLCALVCSFCNQTTIREVPVVEPAKILKSISSFLEYNRDHIKWSEEFVAYDMDSKVISKEKFLLLVSSGRYLPVRIHSNSDSWRYKLFEIDPFANEDIRNTIGALGSLNYMRYKMEGKRLLEFNFVDINGNSFNSETTAGKIVVVNLWFIACAPCREEMPALNKLVERYRNRDDVIFLSLALDSKTELQKFLANTTFKYSVVSDQQLYIAKNLKINEFPTQILINKQGLVVKVLDSDKEIISFLDKESSKKVE